MLAAEYARDLAYVTDQIRAAHRETRELVAWRNRLIVALSKLGVPHRNIAAMTNVSHVRVHQIIKETLK